MSLQNMCRKTFQDIQNYLGPKIKETGEESFQKLAEIAASFALEENKYSSLVNLAIRAQ